MIYITKTIDGKTWQLQDSDGLKVEHGSTQTSKLDEPRKFKIDGGTPPHKPSSTGRIYGRWFTVDENDVEIVSESTNEYYPQVFNLTWVDTTPVLAAPQKTDEPSGQLIGVIITAMINDGIKQGIKAAMGDLIKIESDLIKIESHLIKIEIDKLRDELVTAIENLETTIEDQASEYLIADEHDYVESHDLEDAINSELDSRSWDIADHASDIEDLMQTSLQSEVQSIIQDMVRKRAFVVSLNPE